MPKTTLDYSRSVIYKICHRDPSLTECYVGSTTNLRQRRHQHKDVCTHTSRRNHNFPVYCHIRANGGWDEWQVVPVEEFPCETGTQLAIRERYWVEQLGATLNRQQPGAIALAGGFAEYRAAWYAQNREDVQARQKAWSSKRVSCECGAEMSRSAMPRHRRTAKHALAMAGGNGTKI
jgi:hypothetical protein